MFVLAAFETVAQILLVAVEKAFALDEIDDHQAVEHDGGIPSVVDLPAKIVVRKRAIAFTDERCHAALFSNGRQFKSAIVDRNRKGGLMLIPSEFFDEQAGKVEITQKLSRVRLVNRHQDSFKPIEQISTGS